ncbi:hypothetical protein VT84_33300 [Gemmata sp. SH-PL17]|nr:hypothetical protein VT84_33300 [Gemmata sp. SH-PL17]
MAGGWIKLRTDLQSDPAVIRLASLLKLDTFGVIGRLTTVWVWADTHADRHGHVTLVSRSCLDSIALCDGFGAALESVGWLKSSPEEGGGITFPRFDRHMGEGAKQRAQAANRKQKQRSGESRSGHADVPKMSRSQRDTSVTREEKKREEKKEDNGPPPTPRSRGGCGGGSGARTRGGSRYRTGPGSRPEPAGRYVALERSPGARSVRGVRSPPRSFDSLVGDGERAVGRSLESRDRVHGPNPAVLRRRTATVAREHRLAPQGRQLRHGR